MTNQNVSIYAPTYTDRLSGGQWIRTETGNALSKRIRQTGTNNKMLRPCTGYSATYSFAEYGAKNRHYRRTPHGLELYEISVGPQSPGIWNSKLVREGSLRDAQRGLFGQTLNVAMTAKDLIDANKMAKSWFSRMSAAAPYLRKKQWGKAYRAFFGNKSISKNACNSWLEFQFGVMPTKKAVQEAYIAYAKGQIPDKTVQVRGVPSCLRLLSRSRKERVQADPTAYWRYASGSDVTRYQCVRYLSKEDISAALYRFNLFEVAWDATPWSFAVDWFIPVGDWLKQFGYLPTTHCDGCDTTTQKRKIHGRTEYYNTSTPYIEYLIEYDQTTIERKKNATLEFTMSLSEMLNKSKLGLSCKRTVSAFSLCRQRFSGRGWW